MRTTQALGLGLMAAMLALTGCNKNAKQEKAMLEEENANLRNQLTDRNKALEDTSAEKRSLEQQLAAMRREGGAGGDGTMAPITKDGVTWTGNAGEVTASIEGDVLFDSGKTTLKTASKKSLDSVVSIIKSQYPGKTIRVVGHTDTDPIKKSGFKTNYHLGFERAYMVREYLIGKGIGAKDVSLASYGPDQPKGAKSRRVEIVVLVNQ